MSSVRRGALRVADSFLINPVEKRIISAQAKDVTPATSRPSAAAVSVRKAIVYMCVHVCGCVCVSSTLAKQ